MSQELIKSNELQQKEIATLVEAGIIPAGTPPAQIKMFVRFCYEKGLSPFAGEVHLVSYNTKEGVKYTRITGIEGYRKIAARTNELAGCDDVKFDVKSDGTFKTASELKKEAPGKLPTSATVTVYRIKGSLRVPFTCTVLWEEFAQTSTYQGKITFKGKWNPQGGMPYHMLSKCAEAIALRKGFGDELSGIHIPEEQGAFEGATIENTTKVSDSDKEALELIEGQLKQVKTIDDLNAYFKRNPQWKADSDVIELFGKRKMEIEDANSN